MLISGVSGLLISDPGSSRQDLAGRLTHYLLLKGSRSNRRHLYVTFFQGLLTDFHFFSSF